MQQQPGESNEAYYHRLWVSDAWDTIFDLVKQDPTNEILRTIANIKRYVFSRNRKELVTIMKHFEAVCADKTVDARTFEWAKVYLRRIYRRKNTFQTTAQRPVRMKPGTCPPPPSHLRKTAVWF